MTMHPSQVAQIGALKHDKPLTKVSPKYTDYTDVFFFNLAIELPKNTDVNKHVIKLQKDKQPSYRPIYSLGPVELKTWKI